MLPTVEHRSWPPLQVRACQEKAATCNTALADVFRQHELEPLPHIALPERLWGNAAGAMLGQGGSASVYSDGQVGVAVRAWLL